MCTTLQKKNTYNSDSSSNGFWWQVLAEFSAHCTTVTMWSGHLSPDDSQVIWLCLFAASYGCLTFKLYIFQLNLWLLLLTPSQTEQDKTKTKILLLGSVDIGASLAQVEVSLFLFGDTLDFEQSRVFMLNTVTSFITGEYTFDVQTWSGLLNHFSEKVKKKSKKQHQ